jgi:ubiquinone/menaquinone biosynthesis C-methylase UbiE
MRLNGKELSKIERAGEKYDEITSSIFFKHYLNRRIKLIEDNLRREEVKHALDLGCGTGTLITILKKYSILSVGIDLSINALKKCRGKVLIPLVRGNVWNLPFKDNSFDLVLISGVLHHVPRMVELVFDEVQRILRFGGKIIIDEPNKSNPYWFFIMNKYEADPLGSEKALDVRRLMKSLEKSGFVVCNVKFYGLTPNISNSTLLHFFNKLETVIENTFLSIMSARFFLTVKRSHRRKLND